MNSLLPVSPFGLRLLPCIPSFSVPPVLLVAFVSFMFPSNDMLGFLTCSAGEALSEELPIERKKNTSVSAGQTSNESQDDESNCDIPSFEAWAGVPCSLPPAVEKRFVTLDTPFVFKGFAAFTSVCL